MPAGRDERALRRLLGQLKQLEAAAGRDFAAPRDAARPLDLDLLLVGETICRLPAVGDQDIDDSAADAASTAQAWPGHLVLPHPEMRRRRFVLQPLADLLPDLGLPDGADTVTEALRQVPPQRLERLPWPDRPSAAPCPAPRVV